MIKKTYEEVIDDYGNVIYSERTIVIDDSHQRARRSERFPTQHDYYDGGPARAFSRSIREAYADRMRCNEW